MTTTKITDVRTSIARSSDGTEIAYHSLGHGPGLVIVGGVLSQGSDYMALANALSGAFQVHVIERRGRPGSGPQRPDHGLDDECADLVAVSAATGSTAVFGHSFGGLVTLETVRQSPIFDEVFVYEPGVPLRGQLSPDWLDDYQRRLEQGDRRGAFARMVKGAGAAPAPIAAMPLGWVKVALLIGIRGEKWAAMDRLLEANLVEHRIQAALDSPNVERYSTITAHTTLLGGAKSLSSLGGPLLYEIATAIPNSQVEILSGHGHLAPQDHPEPVASAILSHRSN
jgi:pimeloyl-ACP methyl ester carboxylesterase